MLKQLSKILLWVMASVILFVALVPMLVSISSVNQFLLSCVNSQIAGKLHANEIRVGWTDGLKVSGLTIQDPQGRNVAEVKKLSADVALLSLLHAPLVEGKIQVDAPNVSLFDDQKNGHFSIEDVFAKKQTEQLPTQEPTELKLRELHLALDIQPQGQAKVNFRAQIENREEGSVEKGTISLNATAQNFAELEKAYKSALGQGTQGASIVAVDCLIDNLPLKALLPIISSFDPRASSLVLPAIGNTLNAKINHTLRGDELGLSLMLNSPLIAAKLKGEIKANTLTMRDEGSLSWHIRQELMQHLRKLFPQFLPSDVEQEKPVQLALSIRPESGSLGPEGKLPLNLSWSLDSPLVLKSTLWNSPISFAVEGNATTSSLQESLALTSDVQIATGKDVTSIHALCDIEAPLTDPNTSCKITLSGPIASQAMRFIQTPLPLTDLLGKRAIVEADGKLAGSELSGHVQVQSDTIQANLAFARKGDRVKIDPVTATITLTPSSLSSLISNDKQIALSPLHLSLDRLSAEFPLDSRSLIKELELDLALSSAPFSISGLKEIGSIEMQNLAFSATKKKGQNFTLTSNLALDLAKASPRYLELIGPRLDIQSVIPIAIDGDWLSIANSESSISSKLQDNARAKINARLNMKTQEVSSQIAFSSQNFFLENTLSAQKQSASPYAALPAFHADLQGKMDNFPVSFLCLIAQKPELEELLGKTLSGSWHVGFDNALSSQPLVVSLKGDGVSVQSNLQLGKELKGTPGHDAVLIEFQMSPERLATLQRILNLAQSEKQRNLKLQDQVTVQIAINSLKAPISPFVQEKSFPVARFLDALQLDSSMAVSEIKLAAKEGKALALPPLAIKAEVAGHTRTVSFILDSVKSSNTPTRLYMKGQATDLWNNEGLQFDKARILLDAKIQNLPLDMLQAIAPKADSADQLVAVLGSSLDANVKGEILELQEGTFRGSLQSPRLKSDVACILKKGTLLLEKPITAEYTLTPEAGEVLLKDVNPLLVTAARSQTPISLSIDSKDFYIPLKPFNLKEMRMKNIKIEPGILTCKNGGMLSLLVSLLKISPTRSDEIDLWFTPIYVEVKDGIVSCKRSDALLAKGFPIATWGNIDLIKNKIDMTLGLSGEAISRAFDIPKLDPEYMVQIPIHGTTQSPKIDSTLATTKITALKLQQHRSNTTSLIGGLLEVATTIVEKDAPVPPPTTYPLPWQNKKFK